MKSVTVSFHCGDCDLDYLVPEDHEPRVGDIVLTHRLWTCHTSEPPEAENLTSLLMSCRIGEIIAVHSAVSPMATKFYVLRIPLEVAQAEWAGNSQHVIKLSQKRAARCALDAKVRQMTETEIYRKLAETDNEAKKLLEVLEA